VATKLFASFSLALAAQAEEMRTLSAQVTADTAEPIRAHVTRGMEELRKAG
jgi:hypothetical protein